MDFKENVSFNPLKNDSRLRKNVYLIFSNYDSGMFSYEQFLTKMENSGVVLTKSFYHLIRNKIPDFSFTHLMKSLVIPNTDIDLKKAAGIEMKSKSNDMFFKRKVKPADPLYHRGSNVVTWSENNKIDHPLDRFSTKKHYHHHPIFQSHLKVFSNVGKPQNNDYIDRNEIPDTSKTDSVSIWVVKCLDAYLNGQMTLVNFKAKLKQLDIIVTPQHEKRLIQSFETNRPTFKELYLSLLSHSNYGPIMSPYQLKDRNSGIEKVKLEELPAAGRHTAFDDNNNIDMELRSGVPKKVQNKINRFQSDVFFTKNEEIYEIDDGKIHNYPRRKNFDDIDRIFHSSDGFLSAMQPDKWDTPLEKNPIRRNPPPQNEANIFSLSNESTKKSTKKITKPTCNKSSEGLLPPYEYGYPNEVEIQKPGFGIEYKHLSSNKLDVGKEKNREISNAPNSLKYTRNKELEEQSIRHYYNKRKDAEKTFLKQKPPKMIAESTYKKDFFPKSPENSLTYHYPWEEKEDDSEIKNVIHENNELETQNQKVLRYNDNDNQNQNHRIIRYNENDNQNHKVLRYNDNDNQNHKILRYNESPIFVKSNNFKGEKEKMECLSEKNNENRNNPFKVIRYNNSDSFSITEDENLNFNNNESIELKNSSKIGQSLRNNFVANTSDSEHSQTSNNSNITLDDLKKLYQRPIQVHPHHNAQPVVFTHLTSAQNDEDWGAAVTASSFKYLQEQLMKRKPAYLFDKDRLVSKEVFFIDPEKNSLIFVFHPRGFIIPVVNINQIRSMKEKIS